jgi:hypothetical protein
MELRDSNGFEDIRGYRCTCQMCEVYRQEELGMSPHMCRFTRLMKSGSLCPDLTTFNYESTTSLRARKSHHLKLTRITYDV